MRVAVATLALATLLAAPASADVIVRSESDEITAQGDDHANRIETTRSHDIIRIRETGGQMVLDFADACTQAYDGSEVTCHINSTSYGVTRLRVRGGAGPDSLTDSTAGLQHGTFVRVTLDGEDGDDQLFGNAEASLLGGDGNDRLEGRIDGPDGGRGDDVLIGSRAGATPNVYGWEPGADLYVTRAGDHFEFADAPGPVYVSTDAVANDGVAGEGDNIGNQADAIYGSPFADRIDLTSEQAGGVLVAGRDGGDEIIGSAHPDSLAGGAGADRVAGGGGEDRLHLSEGADDLSGGDGQDRLITAGPEYRGPGVDISQDDVANDGFRGAAVANVRNDVETLEGTPVDDRLAGGAGSQVLMGHDGQDGLDGGAGSDTLYGGAASDLLRDRDGGYDYLDCGAGSDQLQGDPHDRIVDCELPQLLDVFRPRLTLRAPSSISARTLARARGVSVIALPSEHVALAGEARRGRTRLAGRKLRLGGGARRVRFRFPRGSMRTLLHDLRRRSVPVTVIVRATDAAGNAASAKVRVTIRKR